jgi:predicted nucleotidyltransferase component of viral defense system
MSRERDGLARSIQVKLSRHARSIGVDPNLVMTRFAVERLLYRLSRSPHAERFVLKGGLLMLAWLGDTLRPTRDADLLGFGDLDDEALLRIFADLCAMSVEPDATVFLVDTLRVDPIREEDTYGGRRVTLVATLGAARLRVQVDVGIGDAMVPPPTMLDYPGLLDELPQPRLRAYSPATVVAEKLHAIVLLGTRNSRMKDFFDLHALASSADWPDAPLLADAIAATFTRRGTPAPAGLPVGLSDAFSGDSDKRTQWRAFLDKNRLKAPSLDEVIVAVGRHVADALRLARQKMEVS